MPAWKRPPVWAWTLLAGIALPTVAALTLWNRPDGLAWPGKATTAAPHALAVAKPASAASNSASASAANASATREAGHTTPLLDAATLAQALRSTPQHEATAWHDLAALWREPLPAGDPCQAASTRQLQCFRHSGGLALVRQLDRPGVLTLQSGSTPVYALITGLDDQGATLRLGDKTYRVSLAALSTVWRGDFATFWRSPPGYRRKLQDGDTGPAVDWLAARVASLHGEAVPTGTRRFDEDLKTRLHAFQLAQGLKPDGVAGATTFMQLNRLTGVDEPRLSQASRPAVAANTGT